ncbi:MAG: transporter [Peptostreptococcales bacterium]
MKVTNLSSIFAKSFITAALFAFITFIPVLSNADQHYGIGSEGLKAGTVPGPGFYYLMYNNYYTSDTMTDSSGDDSNIGFDISVIANVNRFVYITDKKILGADYGFQLIVPFVYTDLEIKAAGVDDDDFSLSDITVEPLILSWHGAQYDAVFGTALFVPTGEYDKNSSVNIGQDHYTVMLSQGITYYIGEGKGWNISYIARYEKHLENRDLDITYGDDFSVDWGIGKTINNSSFASLK